MPENLGSFSIEPLTSNNWLPWKRSMEVFLRRSNLLDYVDGKIPKPTPEKPESLTEDEKTKLKEWKKKDLAAQRHIVFAVSDEQLRIIDGANSAKEMWDMLKQEKQPRDRIAVFYANRRLYTTDADESSDIPAHINKLKGYVDELHLLGSEVEDKDFACIILASLPQSWKVWTSAYLAAKGTRPLTSNEVIQAIKMAWNYRQGKPKPEQLKTAQSAKAPKNRGFRPQNANDPIKRTSCGRIGHFQKNCWRNSVGDI